MCIYIYIYIYIPPDEAPVHLLPGGSLQFVISLPPSLPPPSFLQTGSGQTGS